MFLNEKKYYESSKIIKQIINTLFDNKRYN